MGPMKNVWPMMATIFNFDTTKFSSLGGFDILKIFSRVGGLEFNNHFWVIQSGGIKK